MKKSRLPLKQDGLSAALLAVTLFLGLFAFSSHSGNTLSQAREAPKTELVISIKANAKRVVSYTKAIAEFHGARIPSSFRQSETIICSFHNRLSKTRFKHNSGQFPSLHQPGRFFQRKTFPQNPDEEVSLTYKG